MTTLSEARTDYGGGHGEALQIAENILLFLAAPLIGLGYVALYGITGMAVAVCFGLKAFGIRCGVFRD